MGRPTFGLLSPEGLSFPIRKQVYLFRILTLGKKKVGGVNLRSPSISVIFSQPVLPLLGLTP